jgi:hypothetical protein
MVAEVGGADSVCSLASSDSLPQTYQGKITFDAFTTAGVSYMDSETAT